MISAMFNPGACVCGRDSGELEFFDTREYLRYKQALSVLQAAGGRNGVEISLSVSCRSYRRIYQTLWDAGTVQVHPAVGAICLPPP